MIKKAYDKLKKQHPDLPEYEKINNEFEISLIEKEDFLLRFIKKKIGEKLELFVDLIDKILQPEHVSLIEMQEYHCFSNEDKKEMLELFKKIMFYYRHLIHTDLLRDEKQDIKIIVDITKEWPDIRKKLAPFIKKLEKCWTEKHETKEILEYLG